MKRVLRIALRTLKYFLVVVLGMTVLGGITIAVCELIAKINRGLLPALWIVAVLTICGVWALAEERDREENAEKGKRYMKPDEQQQTEGLKPSPGAQCSVATYPEMDREIVKLLRMSGENYEHYAASRIEKLESACRIALWIRDRLQERGSFGAGFEKWLDIERVLPPNDQAHQTEGLKPSPGAQCSVERASLSVIEHKLLTALNDEDKVAILATKQNLEDMIEALGSDLLLGPRRVRCRELQTGMRQLLREAFPPNDQANTTDPRPDSTGSPPSPGATEGKPGSLQPDCSAEADCCAEWMRSVEVLHKLCVFGRLHGINYSGEIYNFCPWCGRARQNDQAQARRANH